jgi:hypothetical protein
MSKENNMLSEQNMQPMNEVTLHREGWQPITIRKNGEGYEMLMYVDHYGGKRWKKIPFLNEVIESQMSQAQVITCEG